MAGSGMNPFSLLSGAPSFAPVANARSDNYGTFSYDGGAFNVGSGSASATPMAGVQGLTGSLSGILTIGLILWAAISLVKALR